MTGEYRLFDYGGMTLDEGRSRAYADCLTRVVTGRSVVVDIGAGAGFFALLAARLGARRVYAIEPGDALHLAEQMAIQNGLAGRMEFIHGLSFDVTLPERADVIVSDLHGVLPAYQRGLSSLVDARTRFLAPGGVMIPRRDTLWAAIVESPKLHHETVGVWGADVFGIDMTAARPAALGTWHKTRFAPSDLVTAPACWGVLDYQSLQSPDVRGALQWIVGARRPAHGVAAWFDWDGGDGVGFSNSPLSGERHIYGQAFFPWPEEVDLRPGDEVRVTLCADAVQSACVYRWDTQVREADGRTKAAFEQSDFLSEAFSAGRLRALETRK